MAPSHRPDERGTPLPDEVVELRVHGVGGTPPEEILDVPLTRLVAGDEAAGFFRPWGQADGVESEAYSWGGLTSASRLRALWVLLTPFALANLAGWMLRHGGEPTDRAPRHREALESLGVGVVRAFGIVVTLALASYLAIGSVDLLGYQCGAQPACVTGRWWLWPWDNRFVAGDANRTMTVGAAVAVVAVLAVAWVARRSQIALHDRRSASFGAADDDPAFVLDLTDRRLWDSPHVAHRLGLTHTASALAAIGLTVAAATAPMGTIPAWMLPIGWALVALGLVATLRLHGVPAALHTWFLALAAGYVAAVLVALLLGPDVAARQQPLPGSGTLVSILLPVYALGGLCAGAASYALWRRNRSGTLRTALVGTTLLLGAAGAVNAFGSGLLIRLADLLGGATAASDRSATGPLRPPIVYADWVSDVAVTTVFALLVAVAAAAIAWARAGSGPGCADLATAYADRGGLDCSDAGDKEWAARVGRAQAVALVTDRAAPVIATATVVVLTALAAAVALSDDSAGLGLGSWADPLAAPASVILGTIPVVAVVAISQIYRNRAVRRVVGILWDVATFWPRWFHPWSPPSYAERAVPQLGYRVGDLAGGEGVVLSAHSQGSVLAVSTLTLVPAGTRERVAMLTHGSPLTRLYARFFPEYFSTELFGDLAKDLAGWINLWRPTDFVGGRVDALGVQDHEVFDPPSSRSSGPGEARPVPLRHSHYERTGEYSEALADLVAGLASR